MSHKVKSNDGTVIAYDTYGQGPAVVISGGTVGDRSQQADLAQMLAKEFTVFNFDRRGRGETELVGPYTREGEYEDLDTMINVAGGSAFVYGTSGPGVMVLLALSSRLLKSTVKKFVLWEPPFVLDGHIPSDYKQQLESLLAEGRRGDMVALFLTAAVGMPKEVVDSMRQMPFWPAQEAFAHTLVNDAKLMGDYLIPEDRISRVNVPTLVIDGGLTPFLTAASDEVAAAMPNAKRVTLRGQPHNVDAKVIAPAIIEFFKG